LGWIHRKAGGMFSLIGRRKKITGTVRWTSATENKGRDGPREVHNTKS